MSAEPESVVGSVQPGSPFRSAPRPLGLPPGSVRALLALMVVGTVISQALKGQPVGLLLSETLMIILAHYFASRRVVEVPPDLRCKMEAEGLLVPEANPLWLPRHSVRVIVILAFFGAAAVLLWQGRLFEPGPLATLGLFFSYLGGIVVRWVVKWRVSRKKDQRPARASRWAHGKALAVLVSGAGLSAVTVWGETATLPGWVEKLLLALILFYFGSR